MAEIYCMILNLFSLPTPLVNKYSVTDFIE